MCRVEQVEKHCSVRIRFRAGRMIVTGPLQCIRRSITPKRRCKNAKNPRHHQPHRHRRYRKRNVLAQLDHQRPEVLRGGVSRLVIARLVVSAVIGMIAVILGATVMILFVVHLLCGSDRSAL